MWILGYLILMNALGFLFMLIDKRKAIKRRWRIPEKTLFALAILGGSLGVLAGIYCFRHKTKHKSFTIGIPVILILQLALVVFLYIQFDWFSQLFYIRFLPDLKGHYPLPQ